jgi:HPt (histidine-containing phosphotransfer) domain-containing protein
LAECGPPRLDPASIRRLAEDLENPTIALTFLGEFLFMLPGRMQRILETLADRDAKGALDAILSLKTTSYMAGAVKAAYCCWRIESLIRYHRFEEASETAQLLQKIVAALIAAGPDLLLDARSDLAAAEAGCQPDHALGFAADGPSQRSLKSVRP